MPFPSFRVYSPVDTDSEKGEQEGFLQLSLAQDGGDHRQVPGATRSLRQKVCAFTPWFSTAFFAMTTLLLLLKQDECTTSFGSYELSFDTDMSMNIISRDSRAFDSQDLTNMPFYSLNPTDTSPADPLQGKPQVPCR